MTIDSKATGRTSVVGCPGCLVGQSWSGQAYLSYDNSPCWTKTDVDERRRGTTITVKRYGANRCETGYLTFDCRRNSSFVLPIGKTMRNVKCIQKMGRYRTPSKPSLERTKVSQQGNS